VGGGERAPALPGRPGAAAGVGRDAAGRLRIPGKGMPRRAPSSEATVPAPGADDEALSTGSGLMQAETTMPMSKQGVAKAMVPRGPLARGSGLQEEHRKSALVTRMRPLHGDRHAPASRSFSLIESQRDTIPLATERNDPAMFSEKQ
jgi:hypothetical protein